MQVCDPFPLTVYAEATETQNNIGMIWHYNHILVWTKCQDLSIIKHMYKSDIITQINQTCLIEFNPYVDDLF